MAVVSGAFHVQSGSARVLLLFAVHTAERLTTNGVTVRALPNGEVGDPSPARCKDAEP